MQFLLLQSSQATVCATESNTRCNQDAVIIVAYILQQIQSDGMTASRSEMQTFTEALMNDTGTDYACHKEVDCHDFYS
jgi:hypothetical protein